jgi:hypothetical protein
MSTLPDAALRDPDGIGGSAARGECLRRRDRDAFAAGCTRKLGGVPVRRQFQPYMQAVAGTAVPARQNVPSHPMAQARLSAYAFHQPGQSRQPGWRSFILHGFQLGNFASMYGNCLQVVCLGTCGSTILHGSADVSGSLVCLRRSPKGCHCYFTGRYNERSKRDAWSFVLPADLKRTMALDHIGLSKQACANHMTGLFQDPVHYELAPNPY